MSNSTQDQLNNVCEDQDIGIMNYNSINKHTSDEYNLDNKISQKQRDKLMTDMMDHHKGSESDCEKLKTQISELKSELKTCRQKILELESELADAKQKETELDILLEEQKNLTKNLDTTDSGKELLMLRTKETQLKHENEELKNTVKKLENSIKELQKKSSESNQINRAEAMDKSMNRLMADSEQAKRERDIAQMHLANAESAFSDVHQKYENCKLQVQLLKNSDESLRRDIAINEDTIQKQEQKYEALKNFAMGQIEKYNQELLTYKKNFEGEIARLTAQVKRYEIKSNSLMEALQQKNKECEQLTAVYDEMIGKV